MFRLLASFDVTGNASNLATPHVVGAAR